MDIANISEKWGTTHGGEVQCDTWGQSHREESQLQKCDTNKQERRQLPTAAVSFNTEVQAAEMSVCLLSPQGHFAVPVTQASKCARIKYLILHKSLQRCTGQIQAECLKRGVAKCSNHRLKKKNKAPNPPTAVLISTQ